MARLSMACRRVRLIGLFPFAEDADRLCGLRKMENTIQTGISAADARLTEGSADMSTRLLSKTTRQTGRQGEGVVVLNAKWLA